MKRILFILFSLFFLANCSDTNKDSSNIPIDFNFNISFNKELADQYNSKDAKLKRRYASGDSSLTLHITEQENLKIYSTMLKSNFFSLPSQINPDTFIDKGVEATKIIVNLNGQAKEIQSLNWKNVPQTKELEQFELVRKCIIDILNSKQEYKKLRPIDIVGI